jgi:hypothetical protein
MVEIDVSTPVADGISRLRIGKRPHGSSQPPDGFVRSHLSEHKTSAVGVIRL